ncbi:MAG TPA: hypothetical protein VGG72_02150 [Bryobacteraceae bacterium]|jgi:hypothetical protein
MRIRNASLLAASITLGAVMFAQTQAAPAGAGERAGAGKEDEEH